MLKNLQKIKINQSLNNSDFKDILENSPIKYLNIDFSKLKFIYLYPLEKIAIEELIYSQRIKNILETNSAFKGWKFEAILFDYISTENKFFNYYIDKTFKIDTIFSEEKLPNDFSVNENCLLHFNFCNVRRYDRIIFIGNEKKFIFVQASIHKSEDKLKQYKEKNFDKDIIEIQPFLKINKIKPETYYLIFIFSSEIYEKNKKYFETLQKFNFQYIFFDDKRMDFNYNLNNNVTHIIKPPENLDQGNI